VDAVHKEGPNIVQSRYSTVRTLEVNQSKIETEDEDDSLKYIPILYPEQEAALKLFTEGPLKRPKPKTLKSVSSANIDTYSGRKGFVDLMMSLGQKFENASLWLGHSNIEVTKDHYKDGANVPFTPVVAKESKGA
jgi:hypothetical protein